MTAGWQSIVRCVPVKKANGGGGGAENGGRGIQVTQNEMYDDSLFLVLLLLLE